MNENTCFYAFPFHSLLFLDCESYSFHVQVEIRLLKALDLPTI